MIESELFDRSARTFAEGIDAAIASDCYLRGRLFVDAVRRSVAPGARVLDYGCGPGRIARLVADAGYRVRGVDPSSGMIGEARRQTSAASVSFDVLPTEAEYLDSFADGSYEAVVCSSVIEYVRDPDRLIRSFARVLVAGGVLVLSYANKHSAWRAYAARRHRRTAEYLRYQHNVWSSREVRLLLERAGFRAQGATVFFEAAPFDKRRALRWLSRTEIVGTLGLVVARTAPRP